MRKSIIKLFIFFSFIVGGCSLKNEMPVNTLPKTEQIEQTLLHGTYEVVRVKDGDTFVIDNDGYEITVRLIGVDAPESVHSDESRNTEEGIKASDWLSDLLTGESVYLEYDVDMQDDYGRTLAYAYLDDGTMINKLLLEAGMAKIMTIQPNIKYVDLFIKTQDAARKNKVGIWIK